MLLAVVRRMMVVRAGVAGAGSNCGWLAVLLALVRALVLAWPAEGLAGWRPSSRLRWHAAVALCLERARPAPHL